jgi:superfamily I DNA and/or RNA helicase
VTDAADALVRLRELWRLERAASRDRFAEERRGTTLAERVARGIAVRELAAEEIAAAPGGRALVWLVPRRPAELDDVRLGPGDPVRLWREDPDEPDAVLATLSRVRGGRVGVVVDGSSEPLEEGRLNLDREQPEATFDRGDRAIERFRLAPASSDIGALRAVLFGTAPPRFDAPAPPAPLDADLNEPQRAAVARALAARDLALIHGPPGTGKTRTLVEVIRQAVARGERVLATAASNTAVDNLAERLADAGEEVIRLGHPARIAPAVEHRALDALVEATEAFALARRWLAEARELRDRAHKRRARRSIEPAEFRAILAEAGRLSRDARRHVEATQAALLARTRIICATAAGADAAALGELAFDLVVLDEATQAPDPIALTALARGRRAVLAGDPCQLPPTVLDLEAARAGLATTFFERLAAATPPSLLVVQHRMHREIMAFPSRSMYGEKLVAAPAVADHRLEDLGVAPDPLRPGPWVVIDTAGTGWSEEGAGDDPSTRNPGQAARTAAEVRRLLGRGLPARDLGVITPYDAQVRLLRELLAAERDAGLEIGTVDGFQGREKEAIVLDLVRSNPDGELGFLADRRRLNVALTRARRFLLLVADSATLGGDRHFDALLAAAEAAGAVRSAWSDDAPPW